MYWCCYGYRSGKSETIQQHVYGVKPNSKYYVRAFIKMLNDEGQFFSLGRIIVIVRGGTRFASVWDTL